MNILDFRDGRWLDSPDNRCDECGKSSVFLVAFGDRDCGARICETCLRDVVDEINEMRWETA